MRKISHLTFGISLMYISSAVYAATCTLDTLPSPAVASYEQNIDKILEAIKKEGSTASCANANMSVYKTIQVLDIIQGANYDIGNFFRNSPFSLDTSDKMLLPSAKKHDDYIQSIQQRILETGAEIGGRCGDTNRFKEDVQIGNSRYKTKNRTLQEVLNDTHAQNSEVLSFYRDLSSNVRNNEYLDESKFTMAPEGFSDDMREFYSPANIQQCHDEDAKKQKIQETQKKGLAEAIKYPESVDVWDKVREFLLFGKSAQPDTPEETSPTTTAHAKEGGLGNSVALHNKLFQKIFGFFGNMQGGASESVRESSKQNAADKGLVPITFSEVAESVKKAGGSASPSSLQLEHRRAQRFAAFVQASISSQAKNSVEQVAPEMQQNYIDTTSLIQTIEENDLNQNIAEATFEELCRDIYEKKQAVNYPEKDTCDEILKGSDVEDLQMAA